MPCLFFWRGPLVDFLTRCGLAGAKSKLKEEIMKKLVALVLAAAFAAVSFQVVAQDKKPTAEQCKKDPKMKGCAPAKK
jgi:hypothetical protein